MSSPFRSTDNLNARHRIVSRTSASTVLLHWCYTTPLAALTQDGFHRTDTLKSTG
jgi:hypothetical protein